jgi:hypothetical protein
MNSSKTEIRLIAPKDYKSTHGLFVEDKLFYEGTELECLFLKLKIDKRGLLEYQETKREERG